MKNICIVIFLCLSCFSKAQTMVLRSMQASAEEVEAYIEMNGGTSYAEFLLKQIRKKDKKLKDLRYLISQAQESFLKDHIKSSIELFKSITEMAYTEDWDQEGREIIFYSFLRLAQLEGKIGHENLYLFSALTFDYDGRINEDLFPPPFVKKFKELKKTIPQGFVYLKNIFPFHEIILINGKRYSNKDQLHLPFGTYRITALSTAQSMWQQVLPLNHLYKKRIVKKGFVTGTCQHVAFDSFLQDKVILFPDFCIWKHQSSSLKLVSSPPLKEDLTLGQHLQKYKWRYVAGLGMLTLMRFLFTNSSSKEELTMNKGDISAQTNPLASVKIGF